jgi:hypothetical protein
MIGPKQKGFWSARSEPQYQFLQTGKKYQVIQEFIDYDKDIHQVGEEWVFAGYNFLPYDDGLSLFVENGAGEWHVRMQLRDNQQNEIDLNLGKYIALVSPLLP